MKKYFGILLMAVLGAFVFSSCEDVPEPYGTPQRQQNSGTSASDNATKVSIAEALEIVNNLADGGTTAEEYAITGYITEVFGEVSRNQQSFWISDTPGGKKLFEAYYANLPEGFEQFTVGTKVTIVGKLMKFIDKNGNVVPEMKNAIVEVLEGGEQDAPVDATEVTCAQAAELVNALEDGGTSAETYAITGYITEVVGDVSRNQQTFWMADTKDGGKVFEAFFANLPEGVSAFKAGTKVKIVGKLLNYVDKNGKVVPEMKNATVEILEEGEGGGGAVEGTPVTCAEAVQLVNALADGTTSEETYTITGYITEVIGTPSASTTTGQMQQSFWMADTKDGVKVFQAYWANLPEGVTEFKAGSKVKITGKLIKYVDKNGNVVPEMKNANVEILEEGDGDGGAVEGTPVTCAEAVQLVNALADGTTSEETYAITGYITEVIGTPSASKTTGQMQQSFWIADTKDGVKVFQAYWANLPEGVTEFKAGSKVKITGKLIKYVDKNGNVVPEMKNADVEILEEGEGGNDQGGDQGGDTGNVGDGMTISNLPADITTNAYGSQNTSDESTWLTWTWNGVQFAGCKVCKANAINGTIQMQGNASDAAKQGFIFNKTAWASDIKTITLVLKVNSTYEPAYTLYAGSQAHPTAGEVTPSSSMTEADGIKTYTQVFDLSAANAKFFTIVNNKAGALYIDKIVVE